MSTYEHSQHDPYAFADPGPVDRLPDDPAIDGREHTRRCATECGLLAEEGDRYCAGCGSASDRSAWTDREVSP